MYFSFIVLPCLLFLVENVISANTLWEVYGNTVEGTRFSTLTDINRDNVRDLQISWRSKLPHSTGRSVVPIITDDGSGKEKLVMLFCTDKNILYAIDPTSGLHLWNQTLFHNGIDESSYYCRGVSTWNNPKKNKGDPCKQTVFMGTKNLTLVSVDAATGKPCSDFGNNGVVQCFDPPINQTVQDFFFINVKGPPIVVNNVVAVSPAVTDGLLQDTPKGPTWGFDAETGKRLWTFSSIPYNNSDSAHNSWINGTEKVGGGNAWGIMSGHEELGLIYMPIGSASTDFFGGYRQGSNQNTSAIVAIKALTGEVVWSYQLVHHDIWDYDLACQPTITTVGKNGTGSGGKPVVVFGTKTSFIFVLDAATGEPLHEVEEVPVPTSDVPGEVTYPTQPVPKNANFTLSPLVIDESYLWGSSDAEENSCKEIYNNLKGKQQGKLFTPPSLNQSIIFPGPGGGVTFYGCTINPEKAILVCPINNWGNIAIIIPQNEPYPDWCIPWTFDPMGDTPYKFCMREFRSEVGNKLFCTRPPWKFIAALNIVTGELLWKQPFGWRLESDYKKEWGDPYQDGGIIMTASDLIFVSGTSDKMFHVFDATNGNLLSSFELPDNGNTPITYKIGNTQYISLVTVPGIEIITFAVSTSTPNNWVVIAVVGGVIACIFIIVTFAMVCLLKRKKQVRYKEEDEPLVKKFKN